MIKGVLFPLVFIAANTLWGQQAVVLPQPYEPLNGKQRAAWFANTAFGPTSLLVGLASAGIDTYRNEPPEYGPHWAGYGQRYGWRLVNRTISNGMEASMGSLWGEDPRYHRQPEKPMGARLRNVFKATVVAHDKSGNAMPAYARYIAVPSAAFLQNAWVPDSRSSIDHALTRVASSFGNRILANAFAEFWPDLRRRLHRQKATPDPLSSPSAPTRR